MWGAGFASSSKGMYSSMVGGLRLIFIDDLFKQTKQFNKKMN